MTANELYVWANKHGLADVDIAIIVSENGKYKIYNDFGADKATFIPYIKGEYQDSIVLTNLLLYCDENK